jgi:Tol biopolymer transport system component
VTSFAGNPPPLEPLEVTWSPDGPSRFALAALSTQVDPFQFRPFVINAQGGGLVNLTPTGNHDVHRGPVWSPDGSRLAFQDAGKIRVVNPDGSGLTTLVSDTTYVSVPAWAPDGQHLAYYRGSDLPRTLVVERGVWVVGADGTGKTKVASLAGTGALQTYEGMQFSPDGTRLALCKRDFTKTLTTGGESVVIIPLNGSRGTTLPFICNRIRGPRWSHDGLRLLVSKLDASARNILWTVAANGAQPTQLTAGVSTGDADWSRSGTQIAYIRESSKTLWVMAANGTAKKELTPSLQVAHMPTWRR